MKQLNKFLFAVLSISILFTSCKKDEEETKSSGNLPNSGVLVLNEGQFLASNASISFHKSEGNTEQEMFKNANDRDMGDVLQSVMVTDNYYFFVLNNSGKVEVVNKSNLKSVKTLEGFQSPRYMTDLGNGKALVSNATFTPGDVEMNLDIVNLSTLTKEGAIKVNNWCEQMYLKDGMLYVANTGQDRLLIIDSETMTIVDSISCPSQPTQIVEDINGHLWVMCLGDFVAETPKIVKFNTSAKSIDFTIDLQTSFPQKISINTAGDELFILTDHLISFNVSGTSVVKNDYPNTSGLTSPYALGIDHESGNIFIGDAKDYSSKGSVSVYNAAGDKLYSFESGVNPNSFIFR